MADALGLTEGAKERAQWDKPYRYQALPRMLYRGTDGAAGRVDVEQRIVATADAEAAARREGWVESPAVAKEAALRRQADIGTAAAERAASDRQMSGPAQAEAAAADGAAGAKHLGAIPERPRRPRPSRAKKEARHDETP